MVEVIATGILGVLFYLFSKGVRKELKINADNLPEEISQWAPVAKKYGDRYGVPLDVILSVISVESGGDQYARGSAGEFGLMQLKPIAVKDVRANIDESINLDDYRTDPEANIKAGTAFLALQKKRAGNWPEAIKAYNQGFQGKEIFPDRAKSYLKKINEFRSNI